MTDEFKTIKKSRLPDKEIIWMGFLFFLLFVQPHFMNGHCSKECG